MFTYLFRVTCDKRAVSLLESREQRYIKAINNKLAATTRQRKDRFTVGI